MTSKIKSRNSNIEILRIISMFLIVLYHIAIHGFGTNGSWNIISTPTISQFVVELVSIGGKVGVDVFVIITGYYLVNSKFSLNKVLALEAQVLTYSISIFLILLFLNQISFSMIGMVKSAFPVIYNEYWFATSYMLLYFIFPFINKLISVMSNKEFKLLIVFLIIVVTVLPSFMYANIDNSSAALFILLYLIGAFIRRQNQAVHKKTVGRKLTIVSFMLALASMVLLNLLGFVLHSPIIFNHATHFFYGNSPFILGIAIGIFLLFLTRKNFSNRFINASAQLSFGVYLIHDNPLIRPILWDKIIPIKHLITMNPIMLLITIFLIGFMVYIVAAVIDLFRLRVISKFFNASFLQKLLEYVWKVVTAIGGTIMR